jgi:hypothetical protein
MKSLRIGVLIAVALMVTSRPMPASATMPRPPASGLVGIYGVIEKVVFEPSETAPERVQVWGAFAFANGGAGNDSAWSPVKRGYLYFRLPPTTVVAQQELDVIKREWADLKAVAGTPQAVGFGGWSYAGQFAELSNEKSQYPVKFLERGRVSGATADLRVRPATEAPSAPVSYQTNTGVVKISAEGSHADLVKQLRGALLVKSTKTKR